MARIFAAMGVVWVFGTIGIHLAERGENKPFDTWSESFWNVLGHAVRRAGQPAEDARRAADIDDPAGLGVGLAGLFTGSVASILVAQNLRRREVSNFEMEDHLVLCNWSPRGLP